MFEIYTFFQNTTEICTFFENRFEICTCILFENRTEILSMVDGLTITSKNCAYNFDWWFCCRDIAIFSFPTFTMLFWIRRLWSDVGWEKRKVTSGAVFFNLHTAATFWRARGFEILSVYSFPKIIVLDLTNFPQNGSCSLIYWLFSALHIFRYNSILISINFFQ